ncbi:MAG: DUF2478 domain-containing protein [Pseudomonadota bacterium]
MKIAYTMNPGKGSTDVLLSQVATRLQARGLRTCGMVQTNTDRGDPSRCDMDVTVLPKGPEIRISQSLGGLSRGCRLDVSALERAVGLTERELARGADVLILNKFGKHEAAGRGARGTIAQALSLEIPVILGVNPMNEDAFHAFAQGFALRLPDDVEALTRWLDDMRAVQAA